MAKNHLSPHDRLVKSLMTNKKVIDEFFSAHLPDTIKKMTDFSSIEPQKTSFIDDKLRLGIADLLYSVKVQGEPSYFYVLLEHQSTPDKLLPYRLHKYMIGIMDYHLKKEGGTRLPFIFPAVLYTGEKAYRYSMDFFDLFEDRKELARQTFAQPFHLIDLTRVGDDELTKYLWFGTMAIMLKHVHDPDILPLFKRHLQIFRKIEKEGEEEYLYTILSYVVEAAEVSSKEEFLQTVRQLESVNEEKVMTLVEQLKPEIYQRGIDKGKAEGKVEEREEIARHMFNKGITVDLISEVTGLSIEDIRKASIN